MGTFIDSISSRRRAVGVLAVVGFIALVGAGMWLAVYSTRFVPAVVESVGNSSVSVDLGSALAPSGTSSLAHASRTFGPTGSLFVIGLLILVCAYLLFFGVVPFADRFLRTFRTRRESTPAPAVTKPPETKSEAPPATAHSPYSGFRSFAHKNGALSIDDIVKGLSRLHPEPPQTEPRANVEPIYERVEPITTETEPSAAPMSARGFIGALVGGDRAAVFASLRERARGNGAPERLIIAAVCLLDDAYRARIDGTTSDADIARLVARLDTPTLEKLIVALSTAIDSSYTDSATGAKLALIRALATLGA